MIRLATQADLNALLAIYRNAKAFMAKSHNPTQWTVHPNRSDIQRDIDCRVLYVLEDDKGTILAAFAFVPGPDPTYAKIDGKWLNDGPYFVLHRVASSFKAHGVFHAIAQWAFARAKTVRIDTHEANLPMRKAIAKEGFAYCGVIRVADGSSRLAFQK